MLKNYKALLAMITILFVPMVLTSWGFVLATTNTNVRMPLHEARIVNLEQLSYRLDERYQIIHETLIDIRKNQQRSHKKE
jgi:CHASE1-domain containing sensor protein